MDLLETYFAAWNEPDPLATLALLARCVVPDVEVVHPTFGKLTGIDELQARIAIFHKRMPGDRVVLTSGIDEHHGIARYEWAIVDPSNNTALVGLDIVEFAEDRRIRRVILFHGPLPTSRPSLSG